MDIKAHFVQIIRMYRSHVLCIYRRNNIQILFVDMFKMGILMSFMNLELS
jgi:hypothetical protein